MDIERSSVEPEPAQDEKSPSEQQLIEQRRAAEVGREPGDAFDPALARQRRNGTADTADAQHDADRTADQADAAEADADDAEAGAVETDAADDES